MLSASTRHSFNFVTESLAGPKSCRILEIGCGAGALAASLMASGHDVVAIDGDPAAIAKARQLGVAGRVATWPSFDDGRFDAILFTRSLHHVDDLQASVDAAFAALRAGGRLIVEDFRAEGGTERSKSWFASLARLLDAAKLLVDPASHLRHILGRGDDHEDHAHDLHSSAAIRHAIGQRDAAVREEDTAYYFRYFEPVSGPSSLPSRVLQHEFDLIAAGAIDALGYRLVAERRV
jgi:SAM-dependent methyltransferase